MSIFSSTNFSSAPMTDPLSSLQAATTLLGPNFSSAPITAPLNSLQAATTLFGPDVSSAPITAPLNMFEASMFASNGQSVESAALDVSDDMDVPLPDINDPDNAASQSADAVLNYFEKKSTDEQNAEIQSAKSQAPRRILKDNFTAIQITGADEAEFGNFIYKPGNYNFVFPGKSLLFVALEIGKKNQIIRIKSAADGKNYYASIDVSKDSIYFRQGQMPFGSWSRSFNTNRQLSGDLSNPGLIHLATKKEASLAALSHTWAKDIPYLNHIFSGQGRQKKSTWDTINYYYTIAKNGMSLLNSLYQYVTVGYALSKNTFWAAMNRLILLKRFQLIEGQIKREANWQYKPGNVFLDPKLTGGKSLTLGSAALGGFLLRIHEITKMDGFNVTMYTGKFIKKDKSFVDFVREKIFLLGNTLNTKSYTGNAKGAVQNSVRRAAASGNIDHMFDGKNDPVLQQGKISNRRELVVERELEWPTFPWSNRDLVEDRQFYLNALLRVARNDGYAAAMNRAFETVLDRGRRGDALNVATTNAIYETVRQDIQNYDFGQIVINMLLNVPGTFFQVWKRDDQGGWMLQNALPELEDAFTNNGAQVGDATRRALNNYRDVQNAANLAAVRAIFNPAGVIYNTYGWTRNRRLTVAPITAIMQILNTLLIGGTQLQPGANFNAANGVFERARTAYQATIPVGMIDPRFDIVGLNVWAYKGN